MADDMLKKSIPSFPLRAWVLTNLYKDENGYFQWYPNIHSIHNNHDSLLGCININGRKPYIGETLFVGGENSDILRNTDVKDLKHFFPNVDIKMIPGAGHFVHADKPKEFLETVLKFTK
ncbi:protein ABHD11-like [Xenia sp. Carnegie-2017]|uniref:protein ABHD11-like n=1 Tax=Xenia sp. Carnegie-2017 TaxID=2897299 RepID=UPI001F044436|nr:protein ABHD11-like [Xenia sp. Carnegie-2017]